MTVFLQQYIQTVHNSIRRFPARKTKAASHNARGFSANLFKHYSPLSVRLMLNINPRIRLFDINGYNQSSN